MEQEQLLFNGRRFAALGAQITNGCVGFYKANRGRGIHLYKLDGALEAYIVSNPRQGQFVVSASLSNGAPRYMFSTCSLTRTWLGIGNSELDAIRAMRFVKTRVDPATH